MQLLKLDNHPLFNAIITIRKNSLNNLNNEFQDCSTIEKSGVVLILVMDDCSNEERFYTINYENLMLDMNSFRKIQRSHLFLKDEVINKAKHCLENQ